MYIPGAKKRFLEDNAGRFRIGIFCEEGFPSSCIPENLTPEWMRSILARDYCVVFLDEQEMSIYSLIRPHFLDLIILPYGEMFPCGGFSAGEFQILKAFLQDGGSLMTTGGRPFWRPMSRTGKEWKADDQDPYERFLAELGIKYYEPENQPADFLFDTEMLPGCPEHFGKSGPTFGLTVTTSDEYSLPHPPIGNVFPERIPTRSFEAISTAVDGYGQAMASSVLLARNWQSGSRWCLVGNAGEAHPLNPDWEGAEPFLRGIVRQLASPLMVYELQTSYACYRQGESVQITVMVSNHSNKPRAARLEIAVSTGGEEEELITRELLIDGKGQETITAEWHPVSFSSDLYTVEARLYDDGLLVGRENNGFVIWNEQVLISGPRVRIRGEYFEIGQDQSIFTGVNYYESWIGELMWLKPNVYRLAQDLSQMSKMGINYLRPHYHHSKWFRDYMKFSNRGVVPEYYELADMVPLPSERSLRIFDAFIQLCQKYSIVYGGDLFTLVPEEMGDPRGWLEVIEQCADPEKIAVQIEFLQLIGRRYKDVPGISWDLWNEPYSPFLSQHLNHWVSQLKNALREVGDEHPITIGIYNGMKDTSPVDWDSFHGSQVPDQVEKQAKPFVFQEMWMDQDSSLDGERKQRRKLIELFHQALKVGGAGFVPWMWTRQARLWNNNKRWKGERWDDELGCCVREDMTVKPAGRAFSDLIALLSRAKLRERSSEGKIKSSVGECWIEPAEVKGYSAGWWGMIHLIGDQILAVECRGALKEGEAVVLAAESGSDTMLMAFTGDERDIRDSAEVFVKMDQIGILRLHRRGRIRTAQLVETNGREWKSVAQKSFRHHGQHVSIELGAEDLNYWVRLS